MVKIVDMTSALQQVREKTVSEDHKVKFATKPGEKIAVASYKDKEAAEKFKKDVIAKGGKAIVTSEELSMKATFLNGDDKTFKGKTASDINKQVKEYEKKHNTGLQHDGPMVKEDLNKDDEKTIKPIIKQLQKSVAAHDAQAKQLKKDISDEKDLEEGIKPYVSMQRDSKTNKMNYVVLDKDEKEVYRSSDERLAKDYLRKNFSKLREDLEEQVKDLEEQLKTAEQELEELYIKEDKAYVIRFKRIKDKERMVVVFRNQNDADMYADNIKKQGGQVFSNKLEKIPYKVVDKK